MATDPPRPEPSPSPAPPTLGAGGALGGAWISWLTSILVIGALLYVKTRFDALEERAGGPTDSDAPPAYLPPQLKTVEKVPSIAFRRLYIPVDSQVYHAGARALPFEATLVIRNPSPTEPLFVQAVDYYGESGDKLRSFTKKPFEVGPFQKLEFSAKKQGESEEPGSHFVVAWGSKNPQTRPLVEAVMVDPRGHLVIRREAVPLRTAPPSPSRRRRHSDDGIRRPLREPSYELKRGAPTREMREKNP